MLSRLAGAIVLTTLLLMSAVGSATELRDDTFSTCTTINCSSLRFPGTLFNSGGGTFANTWIANFAGGVGQCLRFDVTVPSAAVAVGNLDLELVVVAPNGTVFRNDDRSPGVDRRPLVEIDPAPNNGWYTVHIAQFSGTPVNLNFVLLHGVYNSGNPNCSSPTPGASAVEKLTKTDSGVQ